MTLTYRQIQKKIEALQREAEKLRNSEIQGVVSRIKVAIAHYGLTAEQLGFGPKPAATAARRGKAGAGRSAKYSDGQGHSWSGRGPRPHWLRDALNAGRALEEFGAEASPTKAASAPRKPAKRRPSTKLYRDDTGHSWTGRGPRPRWLQDALAGGKTLEDLSR